MDISDGKKVVAMTELEKILLQKLEEKDQLITSLQATISTFQNSVDTMAQTIAELNQVIADLKEQLHKTSKNSSKPPSSDGCRKPPAPKSLRDKSGKKSGGQEGHEGKNLSRAVPDHIIPCMPSKCANCPRYDECTIAAKVLDRRQVFDAVVKVEVTEYQKMRITNCPLHGWTREGDFPKEINGTVQYGENLQSLVVALNTVGAVSISRTREILSNVFNVPLSEGTIVSMVSRCAGNLSDVLAKIAKLVIGSDVDHADETGFRVEGKLHWEHVLSNGAYTLLALSENEAGKGCRKLVFCLNFRASLSMIAGHLTGNAPGSRTPSVAHTFCGN
jgi:transposase